MHIKNYIVKTNKTTSYINYTKNRPHCSSMPNKTASTASNKAHKLSPIQIAPKQNTMQPNTKHAVIITSLWALVNTYET